MTVLIDLIAGARPNFMKIAPIIRAMESRKSQGGALRYRLVHTGQHYDARMSGDFFEQLGIPEPDINLAAGSGTQAEQTSAIMTGYEALLSREPSALCLVVGDVTSTMACAIVAQKLHVPVAHVEGGIRSGDWTMPEVINRLVTDAITNWFFTTSEVANATLRRQGVAGPWTFFVGDTLVGPQPYLEFNWLVKHAKAVITDSGGITEEATVMGVPCLTLRDTTERPETIALGTNELIGTDPTQLLPALDRLFAGQWKKGGIPEKWDGKSGERIVAALERLLAT